MTVRRQCTKICHNFARFESSSCTMRSQYILPQVRNEVGTDKGVYTDGGAKSQPAKRRNGSATRLLPPGRKLGRGDLVPVLVALGAAPARLGPFLERREARVRRARVGEVRLVPARIVQPHLVHALDVRDPVGETCVSDVKPATRGDGCTHRPLVAPLMARSVLPRKVGMDGRCFPVPRMYAASCSEAVRMSPVNTRILDAFASGF